MAQIARICLDRVGIKHSHFKETLFDFRHPGSQDPTTTVVIAENGTGKTQALRLFLTSIVPTAARKMKIEVEGLPYWENAVFDQEAGLVLTEWAPDVTPLGRGLFEGGFKERFVTGMIAFRKGDGVVRHFFSLVTREGEQVSTFDGLFDYLTGRSAGKGTSGEEMLRLLDKLKKDPSLGVFETNTQKAWEEHEAKSLGIDIKAFEMQVPMNQQEAGAGTTLVFKDEKQFVDYVIELLVPGVSGWEDPLKRIHGLADQIKRENEDIKPALEGLHETLGPVVDLGVNLNQRILASRRLTSLCQAIAVVGSGVASRRNLKTTEADQIRDARAKDDARLQDLVRELAQLKARSECLEAWIGRKRIRDFRSEVEKGDEALKGMRRDLKVSEAVPFFQDREDCNDRIRATRGALDDLERDEAGLLGEIRLLGDSMMAGWLGVLAILKAALSQADDRVKKAEGDLVTNRKAHGEVKGKIGELNERIQGLSRRIQEVEDAARDMVVEGLIKNGEDAESALARIKEAVKEQRRIIADLQRQADRNDEAIDEAKELLGDCRNERENLQIRIKSAGEDLQAWERSMGPLIKLDWLSRLANQNLVDDEPDTAQLDKVMKILPALLERGTGLKPQLEATYTEIRDRHRELEQVLARMETHGTMPSTDDSELLAQALRKGLPHQGVWTGPEYLVALKDEGVAMGALRQLPGLDAGIVVKDELVDRIVSTDLGRDLILERPVGVFNESMVRKADGKANEPFAMVGMGGRWWFNIEAFNAEVLKRKRDLDELAGQMRRAEDDRRGLESFLKVGDQVQTQWGGKVEALRNNLAAFLAKRQELDDLMPEYETKLTRLRDEKKRLKQCVSDQEAAGAKFPNLQSRLEHHLREAARVAGWLAEREQEEAARQAADAQRLSLDVAAEDIGKLVKEARGVWEDIRLDLREPEDMICRIRPHAAAAVTAMAMDRGGLERDTKSLFAKVGVYEGLTRDRQPERERLQSELALCQEQFQKWERHLEPFLAEGITEDEIRARRASELAEQAEGAIPFAKRLAGQIEKLSQAIQNAKSEIAQIQAVLKANRLTEKPDPDPAPQDLVEAEAWQEETRIRQGRAVDESERMKKQITEASRVLETMDKVIQHLADGQGVINSLRANADTRNKAHAEGLQGVEWVNVPPERVQECERGLGHSALAEGDVDPSHLEDAGVHADSFSLERLQAWAGKREKELADLDSASMVLRRKRGQFEAAIKTAMDREVFTKVGTYYQLRQLFLSREGEDPSSELDRNLAHITTMVRGHVDALELEMQRFRDSKKLSINFLETVANLGLDWFSSLTSLAKYPEDGFGVASLRGQPFLKVVCRPVEQAQWLPILEGVLSDFLKLGNSATGVQLAQMVVQRIARVESVRMRHPDPDRIRTHADGMDDIRTIVLSSGGERLAQVIMMYSALTRLRSLKGGAAKGVLFMDNPFGALTKGAFMEQVRAVADKHRLQLIFTCNVQDALAVADFDHFIGIRKSHKSGPNGEYQRIEAAHLGRMEDLRVE